MWRNFFSIFVCSIFGTTLVLYSLTISFAQVMQSASYQIQSDSINFAGGLSSSTSYVLESTAGEIATGESTSDGYSLRAGYQQMQTIYLALSGATSVELSPSIPGVTGGTSNGSTTVTVVTDNPAGYQLLIAAESSPAMQKDADTIADYTPAGNPDFVFNTGVADSHFGYTPEGSDIVQRFKDNGAACGVGALETAYACWDGLSTAGVPIASSASSNHPLGATTTVRFRVGVGGSVTQAAGIYTATTTVTAFAL